MIGSSDTLPLCNRKGLANNSHNRPWFGQQPIRVPQNPPAHKGGYTKPQHALCQLLCVPCEAVLLYCNGVKQVILSKADDWHQMSTCCQSHSDEPLPA